MRCQLRIQEHLSYDAPDGSVQIPAERFGAESTGRWIKDRRNLMITGPCGVGKTWLALRKPPAGTTSPCSTNVCRVSLTSWNWPMETVASRACAEATRSGVAFVNVELVELGDVSFVVGDLAWGLGVWKRSGRKQRGGKARGGQRSKLLYVLTDSVEVPARWQFRDTVSAVVASRLGDNFNAALAKALGET